MWCAILCCVSCSSPRQLDARKVTAPSTKFPVSQRYNFHNSVWRLTPSKGPKYKTTSSFGRQKSSRSRTAPSHGFGTSTRDSALKQVRHGWLCQGCFDRGLLCALCSVGGAVRCGASACVEWVHGPVSSRCWMSYNCVHWWLCPLGGACLWLLLLCLLWWPSMEYGLCRTIMHSCGPALFR